MEKIKKCRQLYIMKYNREPNTVIAGVTTLADANISDGKVLGMKVIVDNDKPSRVEVGDFTV